MGILLVHANNQHSPNHLGDPEPHRQNRRIKGAWRALGTLAPDRLAALRQVATIESIGSSKLTGASRNTLKQHFRALVERGALNQHGSGRRVWYDLR